MADPLSITTGVLSLLGSCITIVKAIKDFHDGVTTSGVKVNSLLSEVESFTQVLHMMKDTLADEKVRSSIYATGHIGSHWNNILKTIKDGQNTLLQLQDTLDKVNKSFGILDGARKYIRLKDASQEIIMFQQHIKSYRDTMQLSLQTVILWNQVSVKESTDKILPNLDKLHESIRRIAFDINARIVALQTLVESNTKNEQIQTLNNLRDCVQSAASVVSTTSTTLGIDHTNRFSVIYGSEFGDCFPLKPSETILRWVSSNTVYEFEDDPLSGPAFEGQSRVSGKNIQQSSVNSDIDHSDSDNELEVEIAQALLRRGKERLDVKDFGGAESMFRNCHSRTTSSGSLSSPTRDLTTEVMTLLLKTYEEQGKWTDAQSLLIEKIALGSRNVAGDNHDVLSDILHLVEVLIKKKAYSEALLYGRRALKGYRRMDDYGPDGVCKSLQLLITICHAAGNLNEEEAYAAVLSDLKDKKSFKKNKELSVESLGKCFSSLNVCFSKSNKVHPDTSNPSSPELLEPSNSSETHFLFQVVQPSTPELDSNVWGASQKPNLTIHTTEAGSSKSVASLPDGQSDETSRITYDNFNDNVILDSNLEKGLQLNLKMQVSSAQRPQDDEAYLNLYEKLSRELIVLQVTLQDFEVYTRQVTTYFNGFLEYLSSIELIMGLNASSYPEFERKWARFNALMRKSGTATFADHISAVRNRVIEPIEQIIKVYIHTGLDSNDRGKGRVVSPVNERSKLRLDYEKYLLAKALGKKIDKKLSKLVFQYLAVNGALITELPKLSNKSREIMDICFVRFLAIQTEWYSIWQENFQVVLQEAQLPKNVSDIIDMFNRDHKDIQAAVEKLGIVHGAISDSTATEAPSQSTTKDTKLVLLNDFTLPDRPFSGLFDSAMPLSDGSEDGEQSSDLLSIDHSENREQPSRLSTSSSNVSRSYEVLYLACSLFQLRISGDAKMEAGYPYLMSYDAGEIFDVIGEKGELWLAINQDDPAKTLGWIWNKHFARLPSD